MRIEVTKRDIARGLRGQAADCPVALALRRFTKQPWIVGCEQASMLGTTDIYRLPKKVTLFIDHFDSQETVQPFSFFIRYTPAKKGRK